MIPRDDTVVLTVWIPGVITTIPDHEGPTSTFAAGRKSGMAVLDCEQSTLLCPSKSTLMTESPEITALRATMNFRETIGLDASAKQVMWG